MPRIAGFTPRRCSQIRSPVLPSSAWMVPLLLFRNTTPPRASGDGWLVPPSAIGATHASCSSCTLSRVIWFSGLKLLAD